MAGGKLSFAIAINLLTDNFKSGVKSVQSTLASFRRFLGNVFVGIGLIQFTKDVAAVGGAFQDAMARVKSVSNASRSEFKAMREEAILLGATTKYTASQAAEAMEVLVRNGFKARDAIAATSGVLQLAQSQSISLAEAAEIATRAINGFGLQVSDLGRVNDVVAASASNSASNVLEFGEAMKIAAPVAKVLNISMEETMTVLAQLAQRGIKGSDAGTAVKQMLVRLSSQTPQATAVLKKYGLEINETTLRTKGLLATLEEMRLSGMGNSLDDINTFAGMLAAPKFAAALTGPMNELYSAIANSEGEAARMFEESLGEYEKAKFELKSIYENSQVKVFDGLKDLFTEPLKFLTEFIKRIQDLPTLIAGVATIAGAKILSTIAKVRIGLQDVTKTSLSKELRGYRNNVNDVDIASNFNKVIGANAGKSGQEYFKSINVALEETKNKFSLATAGGKEYTQVLKHINTLSTADPDSKKYKRSLTFFNEYKQKTIDLANTDKGAAATRLAVFEKEMQGKVNAASTNGKAIGTIFTNVGNGIKSFGRGLYSLMGGWVGIIITLASVMSTYLVSAYRNSTKMARELNKAHKEAIQKNTELDTTFRSLVDVLRNNERSTTQYKAALAVLKREYPELIDKLELEKISVNNSAAEWAKYKDRIDGVIESQKRLNLATMKIEAQKKLVESATSESDYKDAEKRIRNIVKASQFGDNDTVVEYLTSSILGELSETITENLDEGARKSKIEQILTDKMRSLGINFTEMSNNTVGARNQGFKYHNKLDKPTELLSNSLNKAAKLYNTLEGINTNDATPIKTGDEVINDYIAQQHEAFKLQRESIQQEGDLKKKSAEDIGVDVAAMAKNRLDDIARYAVSTFKGYTDKKGNEIDVNEFIRGNSNFQEILSSSLYSKPVDKKEVSRLEQIENVYKRLASIQARKGENLENKVIDEPKYNLQMKSALESAISQLEQLDIDEADESFRKLAKANEEYAAKIVKDGEEKEKAKQAERERQETEKRLQRLQENSEKKYKNIISGAGKEKINKWDFVSSDEFNEESVRVEYLKNQLDGLKQLRADIGDDVIGLVDELDSSIEVLTNHVEGLEDAFQMKKAQKELRNLKRAMDEDVLNTVTSSWNAVGSLKSSLESISEAFKEGNDWDKFSAMVDGILNLINTISSLISMYEGLSETIKAYQTFQQGLAAVETMSAAEKVTAIQTEAAAVVEAEALKATARSAAMAETAAAALTSSAVIAGANATQFKTAAAAGIAQAVQSAAVLPYPANMAAMPIALTEASTLFASIPALMASIPMLAEGGIATRATLAMIGEGAESEAVLPLSKLNNMLNDARDQGSGGQVKFEIEGDKLVGVLNTVNKRRSKFK